MSRTSVSTKLLSFTVLLYKLKGQKNPRQHKRKDSTTIVRDFQDECLGSSLYGL